MSTTTAFFGITMWTPAFLVAHFAFGWLNALMNLRGVLGKFPLTHAGGRLYRWDWLLAGLLVLAGLWGWVTLLLTYFSCRPHWRVSIREYRERALVVQGLAKLNQER